MSDDNSNSLENVEDVVPYTEEIHDIEKHSDSELPTINQEEQENIYRRHPDEMFIPEFKNLDLLFDALLSMDNIEKESFYIENQEYRQQIWIYNEKNLFKAHYHYQEPRKETEEEEVKLKCGELFLYIISALIYTIATIGQFIMSYLSFSLFLYFTINPIIYEWISIFAKTSPVHIVFTTFATLSDFGLFYVLLFFSLKIVKGLIEGTIWSLKQSYSTIKLIILGYNNEIEFKLSVIDGLDYCLNDCFDCCFCCTSELSVLIVKCTFNMIILIVLIIGVFYWKVLFYLTIIYTVGYLFFIILIGIFGLISMIGCGCALYEKNPDICGENVQQNTLFSMLSSVYMCEFCCEEFLAILVSALIATPVLIGQFYIVCIACINYESFSSFGKLGVILGVIFRIFYSYKVIDINIYFSLILFKYGWEMRPNIDEKIIYTANLVIFFLGMICLIAISIISLLYPYPYVDTLYYYDNSLLPFIKNNESLIPSTASFCSTSVNERIPYMTSDFAILTTLPRLYGKTEDGKCYIKPKFRGVFNSTMKYIFGENYESQNIQIYCWPQMHDPYLIITSEFILNKTLENYDQESITIINEDSFKYIESQPYFGTEETLCSDMIAQDECQKLKNCISQNENSCKEEWNIYTNTYWKSFSEDYQNIKGLEQYQITINGSFLLQPKFIDERGKYMSGTHFLVGGGIENTWGYADLIENIARTFIPSLFGSFIPLYNYVHDLFIDLYDSFSEFALSFIYVENLANQEMISISNLFSYVNFSRDSFFMIGHTISGTLLKEFSYVNDIRGIVFEATNGIGYARYRVDKNYISNETNIKNIANIYSKGVFYTGEDSSFSINGALPSHFKNPNVYDTTCLVSVTCDKTQKYVPFCQQVLTQGGDNSIEEFNKIIDAYNSR